MRHPIKRGPVRGRLRCYYSIVSITVSLVFQISASKLRLELHSKASKRNLSVKANNRSPSPTKGRYSVRTTLANNPLSVPKRKNCRSSPQLDSIIFNAPSIPKIFASISQVIHRHSEKKKKEIRFLRPPQHNSTNISGSSTQQKNSQVPFANMGIPKFHFIAYI